MHPPHLAFSHLKRFVSIERVLTARGLITSLKQRGQRLIGPCPVHHGDNPQAFVVDRPKNLWHCFTRCGGGGDVVKLVQRMDHCNYPEVARYLASLVQVSPTPARTKATSPDRAKATSSNRAYQPYTRQLRLNPHAPLLADKKINVQTARYFEAEDSSKAASQSGSTTQKATRSAMPVAGLIRHKSGNMGSGSFPRAWRNARSCTAFTASFRVCIRDW